jgi:hypothetical protein
MAEERSEQSAWPERLAQKVRELAGPEVMSRVIAGSDNLETEEAKAAWAGQAVTALDNLVVSEATRREILSRCACRCAADRIEELRAAYQQEPDLDHLLELMHGNPFLNPPERHGRTVFITKVPHDPERFAAATTEEERRRCYCHCEYIRAAVGPVSPTYCYCGAGWVRQIFEGVLRQPVRVEVIHSVLQGDDCCRIAVHLPDDI